LGKNIESSADYREEMGELSLYNICLQNKPHGSEVVFHIPRSSSDSQNFMLWRLVSEPLDLILYLYLPFPGIPANNPMVLPDN